MSARSSPKKVGKKQSLSILSSSSLNQLNNQIKNNEPMKPAKERIISESTGLIKFSIKKPNTKETENQNNKENELQQHPNSQDLKGFKQDGNDIEQCFKKMPIYIPINCDDTNHCETNTQELLFKLATQQRKVLDLTEQLKQAKDELLEIEKQCKNITPSFQQENLENISTSMSTPNNAFSLKKSASLINLNAPKINAQQQISKTQKQMAETFNQLTNNLSSINIPNITIPSNDFLLKGKNFFETNINKNIQIGSGIFNSIFNNEKRINPEDENVSVEEENQNYEYSVDFDLDRINKKIRGTILQDLDEDNSDFRCSKTLSAISDLSEDYGGDAISM